MRYSTLLMALAATGPSIASPLAKRANSSALPVQDVDILNYALSLEYLESKFYEEGLNNYTEQDFRNAGYNDSFYRNLQEICFDERVSIYIIPD
jgi:hypothetical protein